MIIALQCLYSYKMQLLVCLFMSHACRSQLVHLARKLLNKGDSYVNCATYISIMPLIFDIVHACMHICIVMYTDWLSLCRKESNSVVYMLQRWQ